MKTGTFIECAGVVVWMRFVSENSETASLVQKYNGHGNRDANQNA